MTLTLSPFAWIRTPTRKDPLAIIAFEADKVVNGLASAGKKSTDPAMLPTIRQILAVQTPKLVVASTQGSHTGFEAELPLEYNFFRPERFEWNQNVRNLAEWI